MIVKRVKKRDKGRNRANRKVRKCEKSIAKEGIHIESMFLVLHVFLN